MVAATMYIIQTCTAVYPCPCIFIFFQYRSLLPWHRNSRPTDILSLGQRIERKFTQNATGDLPCLRRMKISLLFLSDWKGRRKKTNIPRFGVPEEPNLDNLAHMLVTFVTTAVKLVIQSCIIPYVMTRNLISIPMMQSRWRGKVEQGRRRTAVGKQMEMEVRKELWRKCAMPAAGSLHRGELVAKPSLWEASGKIFCASFCAGKGGKALIYGHRLTSGEADADDHDRSVGRALLRRARQGRSGGRQ